MPLFSNVLAGAAGQGGAAEYVIPKSLRFNSGDSADLRRTPATAGNTSIFTLSFWTKRSKLGAHQRLFSTLIPGTSQEYIRFNSDDTLRLFETFATLETAQQFRDLSAWYHIVVAVDSTQATASDRVKLYVNGAQVTQFGGGATYPSQNATCQFNTTVSHQLGSGTVEYYDGLIADFQFVDAQQLSASDFGETRSSDGVWVPKKFIGNYGTNGFKLDFSDSSTNQALGYDSAATVPDLDPKKGMDVITYTGTGAAQSIGGLNFEPGLVWVKNRSHQDGWHQLRDVVRGVDSNLASNATNAENNVSHKRIIFDPNGITLTGTSGSRDENRSGDNYVAWCWQAGGPAVSNSDGTITSQVSANTDYGFSVVGYTGNNTSGATVGHGLSSAPKWVIVKSRDQSGQFWHVYHESLNANQYVYLNNAGSATSGNDFMNGTRPSSSVITLGNGNACNASNDPVIAYCWSEVSGYSKFGSYTGNGSSTGPVVTTGFKPKWVLIKRVDSGPANWYVLDTERDPSNPVNALLRPNESSAEVTAVPIDILSNGFQPKDTDAGSNASGGTYIYAAFADRPGNNWDVNNIVTNEGLTTSKDNFDVLTYTGKPPTQTFGGTVYSATSTVSSPTNVFNGDTSNGGVFNNTENRVLTAGSITINSSLEIYHNRTGSDGITVNINGTDYTATGLSSTGYHTIPIPGSDLPLTTTGNITIKDNVSNAQSTVYAVRVDSTVLIDNTLPGLSFQPDLVWIKSTSHNYNHYFYDSVRGVTKSLKSNSDDAETTIAAGLTSFNPDGFTLGQDSNINYQNRQMVAWCFKAGGTAVTNTDGSITSSVSANAQSGFSIVSYTGTGSNATVGHGLGKSPDLIIIKNRDTSLGDAWRVWASPLAANERLVLNETKAVGSSSTLWQNTLPTSTKFYLDTEQRYNGNGDDHIAYCFANVPGYQRIGSYTGNGSTTGPVVVTGFKPRFVMVKRIDAAGSWAIWDTARENNDTLKPNSSAAEESNYQLDFLSDGFQLKNTWQNNSGASYMYLAIGDDEIGSDEDCLVDVPNAVTADADATDKTGGYQRGNYATLNPLAKGSILTLSNGNLDVTSSGNYGNIHSTIGVSSGKWYYEYTTASATVGVGITKVLSTGSAPGNYAGSYCFVTAGGNPYKQTGGTASSYGSVPSSGDVIGVAFDLDNGTITTYLNGVSQGAMYSSNSDISSGATFFAEIGDPTTSGNIDGSVNFGQMRFKYPMPSGYAALNTTALPAPTIADGSDYFDAKTYSGTGSSNAITGLEFTPDFVWIKERNGTNWHILQDAVRGAGKTLYSNQTNAETGTSGDLITSFDSTGFTVNNTLNGATDNSVNKSSSSFIAWAWDAGSSTVSNTDGSITSSVRANASAGFSIVTYTGSSSGSTVGHGLNAAPEFIIGKRRDGTSEWSCYHKSLGNDKAIILNTTAAAGSSSTWNSTTPSSSVVTLGSAHSVNFSSYTHVLYCFAPVAGYSAFGSYTGNGSNDGPFIYTGFKPAFLMLKRTDGTAAWYMYDYKRDGYNAANKLLYANYSNAEANNSIPDLLSNGFKLRSLGTVANGNGNDYIYMAFAENPFQANGGLAR